MKPDTLFAARSLADPGVLPATLQAVRELGKDTAPFDRERLDALLEVEERFHNLLREDGADMLARAAGGALRDSDISFAQAIQRILAESAIGMQRFLRNRDGWAASAGPALLPRVAARALHAIHGYAKWGCFLGQPGKGAPWKQMHGLYYLAEREGCEQAPVTLLPWDPTHKPTPQALYIQALLLELLQGAGLTPAQLEIADGWFGAWSLDYRLDREFEAHNHLFHVDLAGEHGLEVVRPDIEWETIRFFRAEGLLRQLDHARRDMREGRLVAPVASSSRLPAEDHLAVLAVLERLEPTLAASPDGRIAGRALGSGSTPTIVAGMEPLTQSLASDAPGPVATSGWRVYNRSAHSFGLIADGGDAQPLDPGSIIAIHDEGRQGWVIGHVVHRTRLGRKGALLAGVEMITEQPCPVGVERKGQNPSQGILAPGADPTGRFDALLLKESDYGDGAQAVVHVGADQFRVRLGRPALRGDGWVKARFFVEAAQ